MIKFIKSVWSRLFEVHWKDDLIDVVQEDVYDSTQVNLNKYKDGGVISCPNVNCSYRENKLFIGVNTYCLKENCVCAYLSVDTLKVRPVYYSKMNNGRIVFMKDDE